MADTDIGSSEQDDAGFTPSTSSDGNPLPQRKPPHASSLEQDMLNRAASQAPKLKMSDLNSAHPYGDNGHGMGTGEALRRLGADGRKYGGGQ